MSSGAETFRPIVEAVLEPAGIAVDGGNPWDLRVRDKAFYPRVVRDGSLGLGESYMDGQWDCDDIAGFFARLLPSDPESKVGRSWKALGLALRAKLTNTASRGRAFQVGRRHYDLGNELYRGMLDRRLVYSCACWDSARDLDEAQERKLDLLCRKLGLAAGDRLLDVGCGWGSLAKFAAERYGARVTGITVSREQAALGSELCRGLPVELRLEDYRNVAGAYELAVSVGMFEHVGQRNHRTFFETVRRALREDGLFVLHTIGNPTSQEAVDPWIETYIFPNSLIPSMRQIAAACEGLFVVEDVQNLGPDYDPTLLAWFHNFVAAWDGLRGRYDERFYRMWKYYLLSSAGAFRSRHLQVWQVVLSPHGVPGGYKPVR